MKISFLAQQHGIPVEDFQLYLQMMYNIVDDVPDAEAEEYAIKFIAWKEQRDAREQGVTQEEIQRRNEEREKQLAEIAKLKEEMILTTCPSVEGYHITKQLGLVYGEVVYKAGFLKGLGAAISDLGDTFTLSDREMSGSMKLIDDAREYATNKMIGIAASRGANAVIGIDAESSMGGDIMHTTIYGTAVFLEKLPDE